MLRAIFLNVAAPESNSDAKYRINVASPTTGPKDLATRTRFNSSSNCYSPQPLLAMYSRLESPKFSLAPFWDTDASAIGKG